MLHRAHPGLTVADFNIYVLKLSINGVNVFIYIFHKSIVVFTHICEICSAFVFCKNLKIIARGFKVGIFDPVFGE